jgi:Ca2+-binding EF-hand superfamily protein
LEEKDFVNNIKEVFGHDCKYFGKLLYLLMSDGYDRKKIHFLKFLECLYPLFDMEKRLQHNKICFQIFDVDRDGSMNILNIIDLVKNLKPETLMGEEIFKVLQYQIKNLT